MYRQGSPADLIKSEGPFWDMVRNTGEYDELVALIKPRAYEESR